MNTPSSQPSYDSIGDVPTNLIFFSNEFPSDDLRVLFRQLQRHSKDSRFWLLAKFLDESTNVVKQESLKLPQFLRDLLPSFDSVLSLVERPDFRQGPLGGALESALLCVLQLGILIVHNESQTRSLSFRKESTVLSGLSIGLLAAAALSVSTSVADLALAGVESVRVAFRLGIHVDRVSQSLESRDTNGQFGSWAYVVTGVSAEDVQAEINEYNIETCNPVPTKVFISAADKTSVSVTGPPSRLKNAFRRSHVLRYSKHVPMPVYNGLCHAPHIYSQSDVDSIVNGSEAKCKPSRPVQFPLLSPNTGRHFQAEDAGGLFNEICTEVLTGPIYFDNLTSGIVNGVLDSEGPGCEMVLFGTSLLSKTILSTLESQLQQAKITTYDLVQESVQDANGRVPRGPKQSKLAIVGMSCRMPGGADDVELFWKLMEEGRDTHKKITADRFDLSTHFDPTGKIPNTTPTPYGNFIDRPGLFDAGFFNMSPREAEQTDPMHRLALITAYEALEMSGYAPNRTPSTNLNRIGTYYGQASDDWREVNGGMNIGTHAVPGGERAFANGRINYFFKFGGPSFNVDTACSSGLAAVHAACAALWAGEADTVIAGGLSVITNPDNYAMLGKGHFLSPTGQCKVWDEGADGYCRADGIGSVVIKRLEDAEADNDNILSCIVGGATNHSAEAASITQPHAGAQKQNYAQVMNGAGIDALDVGYVELHGTGTQVGDAIESESVADFFAPVSRRRRADQKLHLGAVKSNIGHGEAAAGIASLLKMLLVFQKNQIPPHVGIKTRMNPRIPQDLEKRQVDLPTVMTPWPKPEGRKRYGIVNSFGAHGGNTTLLLEDAPQREKASVDPRPAHVVTISAKSKASLKGNVEATIRYLEEHPETNLGDLAYTTCVRRMHHNFRIATSVTSVSKLQKFLTSSLDTIGGLHTVPTTTPAVAFAFTGQGAFYSGTGLQLFKDLPTYRSQILQLDQLVQSYGFPSVVPAIEGVIEGEISPLITQLTIVVSEIALTKLWASMGIKPDVVIGHSLGEYAALVAAGVLSAADAIFLAGKRAELLLAKCQIGSHVMLSVRASVEVIKEYAEQGSFEISCINGQEDIVISGPRKDIESVQEELQNGGIKCLRLDIPFAFHTAQIQPVLEPFENIAQHVTFKTPDIPIISPLLGNCVFDGKSVNAKYLSRASREAVDFIGALDAAQDLGIVDSKTLWIDIGPHPVSGGLIGKHFVDSKVVSSLHREENNFATFANSLANLHCEGVAVDWNEYMRPHEQIYNLLTLDSYRWNEKDYWITYTGTWTLDKAFQDSDSSRKGANSGINSISSSLKSSSVHHVITEELGDSRGTLITVSDIMQPDLLSAVNGHFMNGHGVSTSSIWADMAFTVGEYLFKQMVPRTKEVPMNLAKLEVLHAQIAQADKSKPQKIQLEANLDLAAQSMELHWYNVSDENIRSAEAWASAMIYFEDPVSWTREWSRVAHLVQGRMDSLSQMASQGKANKLSKNMTYTLFKNVVDYSDKYRGMQSVVLNDLEAYAEVTLVPESHGTWHTPPHWFDSVFHIGGLVMNGSDASNTRDFFYVTPGWDDCRMIKPLTPGASFRSYVRMFPTEETNMYAGDVYVFQDDAIVAMMGKMKFRRVPRVLMDTFFSPPDSGKKSGGDTNPKSNRVAAPAESKNMSTKSANVKPPPQAPPAPAPTKEVAPVVEKAAVKETTPQVAPQENSTIANALALIARETGLELAELTDDASFVELGVDSLMSLMLSELFRSELSLEVKSSLFVECSSIAELKEWLEQRS